MAQSTSLWAFSARVMIGYFGLAVIIALFAQNLKGN
jgi:hypothetical protein